MPFNADGSYTGTDAATPHVLVAKKAYTGQLRSGHPTPVAAGQVLAVQAMGTTNALAQPQHPHWRGVDRARDREADGRADGGRGRCRRRADGERKAAIEVYRKAEAAKPKPAPVVPLTAHELAALRALIAKPAP